LEIYNSKKFALQLLTINVMAVKKGKSVKIRNYNLSRVQGPML
jgi:hypothetical protein